MRRVHFIGIGGVGMNGLAQLAAGRGYQVSGSDRAHDPQAELFKSLESLGIRMCPQDGSGIDAGTDQVVFSTAIESDNPDLQAARTNRIELLHRAQFLQQLIGGAKLIAVAGTAGKTTTTGMLGWIFECLGKNPSVYNGAAVLNWKQPGFPGNVRSGCDNVWIIEADESDRSFLHFHPAHSIITNVSKDHFELAELHRLFDQFRRQTSGTVIEGTSPDEGDGNPMSFTVNGMKFEVPLLGRHNLQNAHCAVRLCSALGLDLEAVREALRSFRGIERRLEVSGNVEGVTVIDDYAHNPVKISAALAAVAETHAAVHAYWRPHGFTPLHQGMEDLVGVFVDHWESRGGSIFILPVYYAGGTVERKSTAADLVKQLQTAGVPAVLTPDYNVLKLELEARAQAGDAILGMGARDPELPLFSKKLVEQWKKIPS